MTGQALPPRVALLVPSTFLIDEPVCRLAVEIGLRPCLLRVPAPGEVDSTDADAVADMVKFMGDPDSLAAIARTARDVLPDVVAWGCTSGSFIDGGQMATRQAASMMEAAGVPAITTSQAMLAALDEMDARTIAVITPYLVPIGEKFVSFRDDAGFKTIAAAHLGAGSDAEVDALSGQAFAEAITRLSTNRADALVIPCTAVDEYRVRPALGTFLGPVVFANRATLEQAAALARP
jgi:maleate isomerase